MRGAIVYDEKNSPLFGLHPTFQAQQPLFEYHGYPCLGVVPVFTGHLGFPNFPIMRGTTSEKRPTMLYTATCGADSHPPPRKS